MTKPVPHDRCIVGSTAAVHSLSRQPWPPPGPIATTMTMSAYAITGR